MPCHLTILDPKLEFDHLALDANQTTWKTLASLIGLNVEKLLDAEELLLIHSPLSIRTDSDYTWAAHQA
ncbi:hypothetical protein TNCV_1535231 [Trichonephila clavipes]|uniref:Uncharacterized protein n=1 Tax=Trichonephila clavipes TaxID=2585209 RepID=A0A8X6R7M2_TRICX|nr:hypothetical protein TNCV_1535231 [Trichonephila clavipes]